ncbi:MAG: hypothetical protein FWG55_08705 [Candidatus Bathyarchaeota archaeon]|nr:hypothetical protein [Candidatus Termiticorpusculum sp.]
MGYHPRTRSSKRVSREYRKAFREKGKFAKHPNRHTTRQDEEEKTVLSRQQIFEITLKRLHTLGNQKFGSSPFSDHFDRWLLNVETVLDEFETQPDMNTDEQFTKERNQVLAAVKLQLENHRHREANLEKQINNFADAKNRLQQTNNEYLTKTLTLKGQKNAVLKRLNKELEILKKEQDQIIKLKTGFFRGISRKEREQKEVLVMQQYNDKQQELEVTMLNFKEKQKQLKEEFECKRDPLLENVKVFQRCVKEMDEDISLEERWFACEALSDVVNNFFQRKINKPL